jgi:hypothetical protein
MKKTTSIKDWSVYHIWNRNDMNLVFLYHKPTKEWYHNKFWDGRRLTGYDLPIMLFSPSNGNCKRAIKIHEDDFFRKKVTDWNMVKILH